MIVNAGYRGKIGAAVPKFTYTGQYNVRKDGVVELLTSGTIVFLEPKVIDVFMVGGGGCGSGSKNASRGVGGGGGGYTRTVRKYSVAANTSIPVTIGVGAYNYSTAGSSSFNALAVNGGKNGQNPDGGDGGSGGGGGVASNSDYGAGGYNGANGEQGYISGSTVKAGVGQGFTTREFGEATGKLYAGGGGGGRYMVAQQPVISMGGPGGGGSGGWVTTNSTNSQPPAAGVANTGGGGGGGYADNNYTERLGGAGGSGIVCFREAAELPELAGTWVLNERLYAPESNIPKFQLNYQAGDGTKYYNYEYIAVTTDQFYGNQVNGDYNQFYQFSRNVWSYKYKYLTFPTGATASDEFRAWLASNATKQ